MNRINSNNIQAMMTANMDKNAVLCTDEATVYQGVRAYKQLMVNHSTREFVNGEAHTNSIESVWALLNEVIMAPFTTSQISLLSVVLMSLFLDLTMAILRFILGRGLRACLQVDLAGD